MSLLLQEREGDAFDRLSLYGETLSCQPKSGSPGFWALVVCPCRCPKQVRQSRKVGGECKPIDQRYGEQPEAHWAKDKVGASTCSPTRSTSSIGRFTSVNPGAKTRPGILGWLSN